jgi:hypothetical protein
VLGCGSSSVSKFLVCVDEFGIGVKAMLIMVVDTYSLLIRRGTESAIKDSRDRYTEEIDLLNGTLKVVELYLL